MKQTTLKLIDELKNKNEDFEWYPTTDEILKVVSVDIVKKNNMNNISILDIGAGNGKALEKIEKFANFYYKNEKERNNKQDNYEYKYRYFNKYAIEKSQTLIANMTNDIFILGTDFQQQTLIDKNVDIIFCNPPYSEYQEWTKKILKESNAKNVYLIIPTRWQQDEEIQAIIKERKYFVKNLGLYSFDKAERQARAVVNIVCFYRLDSQDKDESFDYWFKKTFKIKTEEHIEREWDKEEEKKKNIRELVKGRNLIEKLEELYKADMEKLLNNYRSLEKLDCDIIKELGVDIHSLKKSLNHKIKNLKRLYWQELFNNFTAITERLTSKSRKKILDILQENVCIDYTLDNAYTIVFWTIKNANKYIDTQLVDVYKELTDIRNIEGYKSNKHYIEDNFKVYKNDGDFEIRQKNDKFKEKNISYKLDYRLITDVYSTFGSYCQSNKLNSNVVNFVKDIFTIAKTLGFNIKENEENCLYNEWLAGEQYNFYMNNDEIFMSIRVYRKGTIHYKFNKQFMQRFNLEVGRLLGWLKDYKQASEELEIPIKDCMQMFNSIIKLENNLKLLCC